MFNIVISFHKLQPSLYLWLSILIRQPPTSILRNKMSSLKTKCFKTCLARTKGKYCVSNYYSYNHNHHLYINCWCQIYYLFTIVSMHVQLNTGVHICFLEVVLAIWSDLINAIYKVGPYFQENNTIKGLLTCFYLLSQANKKVKMTSFIRKGTK